VYEVYLEQRAQRDLKKLSAEDFDRVIRRIKALAKDPRRAGCRKISGSKNDWRIRVGDYRVIYEIDNRAKAIRVMLVRHRRDVYRK